MSLIGLKAMSIRRKIIIVTFSVLISVELIARALHLADVPVFKSDADIGYIPVEDQSGKFALVNDWFFNNKSMGTDRKIESGQRSGILLVGDSIVLGGNAYSQQQRLGPQLEKFIKTDVWPISAGSWALQNELAYLRKNIELARNFEQIVLILNSDDFGDPSYWKSELTHPTFINISHALFFLNKYFLKFEFARNENMTKVKPRNNIEDYRYVLDNLGKPVYIFIYPTKNELLNKNPCSFIPTWMIENYSNNISCISDSSDWKSDLYADAIHPNVRGTSVLARILADQLSVYSVRDANN